MRSNNEDFYGDGAYYSAHLRNKAEEYMATCFTAGGLSEMKSPEFGYMALAVMCDQPYNFTDAVAGDDEPEEDE